MKKTIVMAMLLGCACLHAADEPFAANPKTAGVAAQNWGAPRFWKLSLIGLSAANALDLSSSWGKRELNGVLRSSDGSFGVRGAALKMSFQGGLVAAEYLFLRHDTGGRRHRIAAWVNLAVSAGISAVAARNFTIARGR